MSALVDSHGIVLDDALWSYADHDERQRFAAQVFTGTNTECWIVTAGIESHGGYGRWRPPGGQVISTHRWSYLAHWGPTDEPVIRHDCDIRCCANPHHLVAGTQAQNIRDTVERGAWRPIALPIWPARSHRLRDLARLADRAGVNAICERAEQLRLFATTGPVR